MKLRNVRSSDFLGARNSFRQIVDYERLLRNEFRYVFRAVGTSRYDVRAACSGATPSNAGVAGLSVPPATPRAGTAQRAVPTRGLRVAAVADVIVHIKQVKPGRDVFAMLSRLGVEFVEIGARFRVCRNALFLQCRPGEDVGLLRFGR